VNKLLKKIKAALLLLRLRPFDTSTEAGRSKERLRRAAITTVSAGGARAIAVLASLVTVPLTYHYLGAERYGLWMVLISIIGMMSFADLGIGNGLVNAVSEAYGRDDQKKATEYVTSAFVMMVGIALALAALGTIIYPFLPWMRLFNVKSAPVAAEGASAFLILFFSFVVSIPLGVVSRAQAGLQQGYFPQIVGALGSVLTLLALLVVIAVHGSLGWLVFATTIGPTVGILLNARVLFREHPWLFPSRDAYSSSSAKRILKLGLMFFVLQCAFAVSYSSDNIVITQVLGAAAVAAYAVPQKLFSPVSTVVGMAVAPLWPAYGEAIARGDVTWVRRVFRASLMLTLGLTIPICAFLAAAGPYILRTFFGKSLNVPISLLVVLAAWGVVNAVSTVISILLNGAGVLRAQVGIAIIASTINLGLSIFLTRRVGIVGVCAGSLVSQVFITFPFDYLLIRQLFARLSIPQVELCNSQNLLSQQ